jgi:AraC family ethanolamine operon transcriptional activator
LLFDRSSERTLEYSLKGQYNLTPKAYLIRQRLAKVREALTASDPESSSVYDIAVKYNFWHTGQFASDYRKIYGENPNTTLARHY